MKIVGDFKDYYDHLQDPTSSQIYVRNTVDVPTSLVDLKATHQWPDFDSFLPGQQEFANSHLVIVGFCGRIYFGIGQEDRSKPKYPAPRTYRYDRYDQIKRRLTYMNRWGFDRENLLRQLVENKEQGYEMVDIFHHFQAPVFVIRPSYETMTTYRAPLHCFTNPCLKDLEFFRVMHPQQCYQEIDMFLSGVLGDISDPMGQQTDKEKVEAHGFDAKISFRKERHQRKSKR